MQAEIVAIGDELTSGARLDTNSQWISQQLGDLGVEVLFHTTVADQIEPMCQAITIALNRTDLVILSGGLGPTADDLTREAIAKVLGVPLELNDGAFQAIVDRFKRLGRPMPEKNRVQALFPIGSTVIPNPNGTAPGVAVAYQRAGRNASHLFALPGVPAELFEMWRATVSPDVLALMGEPRILCHHRIKCFGAGESQLEAMLPDIIARGRVPSVGITVHEGTITLRISASGESRATAIESMQPTIATIRDCLGDLVFGEEDDELQDVIVRHLAAQGKTIATFEWGTQGLLARWLSTTSDAADVVKESIIALSTRSCATALDLPDETLASLDPLGEELAILLAERVRQRAGADYGLAIEAMPTGLTTGNGPAYFHVAIASEQKVLSRRLRYGSHPAIVQPLAAKNALDFLRLELFRLESKV